MESWVSPGNKGTTFTLFCPTLFVECSRSPTRRERRGFHPRRGRRRSPRPGALPAPSPRPDLSHRNIPGRPAPRWTPLPSSPSRSGTGCRSVASGARRGDRSFSAAGVALASPSPPDFPLSSLHRSLSLLHPGPRLGPPALGCPGRAWRGGFPGAATPRSPATGPPATLDGATRGSAPLPPCRPASPLRSDLRPPPLRPFWVRAPRLPRPVEARPPRLPRPRPTPPGTRAAPTPCAAAPRRRALGQASAAPQARPARPRRGPPLHAPPARRGRWAREFQRGPRLAWPSPPVSAALRRSPPDSAGSPPSIRAGATSARPAPGPRGGTARSPAGAPGARVGVGRVKQVVQAPAGPVPDRKSWGSPGVAPEGSRSARGGAGAYGPTGQSRGGQAGPRVGSPTGVPDPSPVLYRRGRRFGPGPYLSSQAPPPPAPDINHPDDVGRDIPTGGAPSPLVNASPAPRKGTSVVGLVRGWVWAGTRY